jgi:hypothetical protein
VFRSRGNTSGLHDVRRGYARCGRRASVRWCYDESFPKGPSGVCILVYVIGVVSSFGYLHINQVERGRQPSLKTLAHLLLLFSLPIFLRIFIGLA